MADRLLLSGALAAALASLCCRSAPLQQAPVETPQVDRDLVVLAVDVSASVPKSPTPLDTAIGLFEKARLDRTEVALFAFADKALKFYPDPHAARTGPGEQLYATRDTVKTLVRDRTPKQPPCNPRQPASVKSDELDECKTNFNDLFKAVNELIGGKLNEIGRNARIFLMVFSDGNDDSNEGPGAACVDDRDGIDAEVLMSNLEHVVPLSITLVFTGRKECAAPVRDFWVGKFEKHNRGIRSGDRQTRTYFGFESIPDVHESHVRREIVEQVLTRPHNARPVTLAKCSLDQEIVRAQWNVGPNGAERPRLFSAARLDHPGMGVQQMLRMIEGDSLDVVAPGGTVIQEWSRLKNTSAQLDTLRVHFGFTASPSLNADDYRDPNKAHLPEPFVHSVICVGKGAAIDLDVASFDNLRWWPEDREFRLFLRPGQKREMDGRLHYLDKADTGIERYPRLSASDPDTQAGIALAKDMQLGLSPRSTEGATGSWLGEVWVAGIELSPEAAGNVEFVRILQDGQLKDARRMVAFYFGARALFTYAAILVLSGLCWWMCRAHVEYRVHELIARLRHRHPTPDQPACDLLHEGSLCVAVLLSIGACFWLSLRPVWFQTLSPSTAMLGAETDLWRAVPLVLIVLITGIVRFCFPSNRRQRLRVVVRLAFGLGSAVGLLLTGLKEMNLAPALFMIVLAFWVTGIVDPLSLVDGNGVPTEAGGAPSQPHGIESPQES